MWVCSGPMWTSVKGFTQHYSAFARLTYHHGAYSVVWMYMVDKIHYSFILRVLNVVVLYYSYSEDIILGKECKSSEGMET